MVNYLSRSIAYFFAKKNIIPNEELDSYIYGFEIILISSVNWGIILLIMLFTGIIPETILYMASVILLRHHTGGYHASTHINCSVLSISSYILILLAIHFLQSNMAMATSISLVLISLCVIFKFAPMTHENNPVKECELHKHKLYSRILSLFITTIVAVLILTQRYSQALSLSLGLFQVSVFLLLENNKNKRRCCRYEIQ